MADNEIIFVGNEIEFSGSSGKLASRTDGKYHIVSTGPDVCKTPMGSTMVPVAYSSIAFFDASVRTSATVRLNGKPDFQQNSRISSSKGTEAGTGQGVVKAGHLGPAKITSASGSVNSVGHPGVRHGDSAEINLANLE